MAKQATIECGPFGWLLRLPDGSAARGSDGRFPRYFKSPGDVIAWFGKQRAFIAANGKFEKAA